MRFSLLLIVQVSVQVLWIVQFGKAEKKSYSGYQVIRVKNDRTRNLEEFFENYSVDIWKTPSSQWPFYDVMVQPNEIQAFKANLKRMRVHYDILIDDVQDALRALLRRRHKRRPTQFRFDEYNTYAKIIRWMKRFARLNKDIVSLIQVGSTWMGRRIYALKIQVPSNVTKPVFWQDSLIHAREWVTGSTLLWVADNIIKLYRANDPEITRLLRHMDFIILPVWNIDGYIYTWKKDRLWRKSRKRFSSFTCKGVDLNRNFLTPKWSGDMHSDNKCSRVYHGSRPFSEMETSSVAAYMSSLNISGSISLHSYAQLWLYPYGFTSKRSRDHLELENVATKAVRKMQQLGGAVYKQGPVRELAYVVSGGSIDWSHLSLCVKFSFGVELRDEGKHGFILPPRLIVPTAVEYFHGMTSVATSVLEADKVTSSVCEE